jgi:hypothetical protein
MSDVTALPILPDEVGDIVKCKASACRVGDRTMLALPYRAGFGRSRGRRYRITIAGLQSPSQLLMVVGERAMIPLADDSDINGITYDVTIRVLAQRPALRVPADFSAALEAKGLRIEIIAAHELNQLITMIRESASSAIRRDRILNAVAAVAEMTAERAANADNS